MAIVLDGTNGITNDSGYTGDGVSFADSTPANTLVTTSGGNVGIGTSTPVAKLDIASSATGVASGLKITNPFDTTTYVGLNATGTQTASLTAGSTSTGSVSLVFNTASAGVEAERMRITSSGVLLVGKSSSDIVENGFEVRETHASVGALITSSGASGAFLVNRQASDGILISFRQANTQEGTISVSGTTVSYNGGHLSRWAQTTTPKDESLVKGTVLSNLDEMNVYTDAEGNTVQNEQLNKVKVSDVEGDANVAGVFVNWEHDEAHDVDEINMAMTGDMIIRIAQGVTVQRGDLLMSAGDGTAEPQGDDIVRSKTIAKVTSTHVTCTYADGSFCVPCVLMAC
jgi:hypothetical protein